MQGGRSRNLEAVQQGADHVVDAGKVSQVHQALLAERLLGGGVQLGIHPVLRRELPRVTLGQPFLIGEFRRKITGRQRTHRCLRETRFPADGLVRIDLVAGLPRAAHGEYHHLADAFAQRGVLLLGVLEVEERLGDAWVEQHRVERPDQPAVLGPALEPRAVRPGYHRPLEAVIDRPLIGG